MNDNKIIQFPRKVVTCRTCGTHYRLPPPGDCGDCRHWHGEWRTLQQHRAIMRRGVADRQLRPEQIAEKHSEART